MGLQWRKPEIPGTMANSSDKENGPGTYNTGEWSWEKIKKKMPEGMSRTDKNSLKGFLLAKMKQSEHPINVQ